MTEIAKTGFYVGTYDRDIFITKQQCEVLYKSMDSGISYFDIGDTRIMMHQVKEILPSSEYNKSPKGGYYCPKHPDNFIAKNKTCGYCGR